ncbi:hypothetical protein TYRP_012379 [Tyrophagus putrescentiae]|nr:hypothetical protein TYRP_012379 [Tyrophagus putrescentiae]
MVAGEYYSHTQSQLERDSLRSGSECSIPPPPPPPALSHFRNRMQQQQQQHGYYNRPATATSSRGLILEGNGQSGVLLNEDIDEGIIDEAEEASGVVGHSEHRSTMELNDEGMDEDVLTDNDLYPSSNGRLPAQMIHHPGQQQQQQQQQQPHYLLRGQSTLDEEDDSANSVPLTNSNAGYGSGSQLTPVHRQPFYRSEAVIEMGAGESNNPNAIRQGVAIMR